MEWPASQPLQVVLTDNQVLGGRGFSSRMLGVSLAATWTWAVSVLVGMALLREQGVIPFFVWFIANTAAIPVFGWASRKWPALWNQTRRLPMRVIMSIMLVFTIWINMSGVVTMNNELQWFSSTGAKVVAIALALLMWFAVAKAGLRWSVLSDRVQWWLLYGSAIAALVVTIMQKGLVFDVTLQWGSYATPRDWLLGLWTVPLLLANPFIDATFWQRAKYSSSMRPYWWGFWLFLSYLAMVAILGLLGPTPLALALLYIVVFCASSSTIDSSATGLQLTAGKGMGVIVGMLVVLGWIFIADVGLLDAWAAMFSWFPLIFIWQCVTYYLEKKRMLKPVERATLEARDALPLI